MRSNLQKKSFEEDHKSNILKKNNTKTYFRNFASKTAQVWNRHWSKQFSFPVTLDNEIMVLYITGTLLLWY